MAVVVRLAGAAPRSEKVFEEADDLAVDDIGCLAVTCGFGKDERTLAVYAPGVWTWAEVR